MMPYSSGWGGRDGEAEADERRDWICGERGEQIPAVRHLHLSVNPSSLNVLSERLSSMVRIVAHLLVNSSLYATVHCICSTSVDNC